MSNPTSNFNWQMPTNTDLVSQLPADFEVFGQAVDTSLADLKGGTTNQVLAKNSNTDMDFKWVTDATGMTNPMTTTGDTIYSSSGSTPARLGIGSTGQVLTVSGGVPVWSTISAGGYTLLTSGAHSGDTLSVTSIPATYKELVMFFDGYDPTTDGDNLQMRFNQDGNANRHYEILINNYADTSAFNASLINISRGNDNTVTTNNTIVRVPNYATTAGWKLCEVNSITVSETTTTSMRAQRLMGFYNQTTAISSFNFYTSSGNTFAVNYKIYGVA